MSQKIYSANGINLAPAVAYEIDASTVPYFVAEDDEPELQGEPFVVANRLNFGVECSRRFSEFAPCQRQCAEMNQAWLDARAAKVA